ncbi:MAG: hypothetical protein JWM88_215, partial [Verrucomicrobia bacterium]|nr:hypothetical protein [Verrucomicrobiota bacterium]
KLYGRIAAIQTGAAGRESFFEARRLKIRVNHGEMKEARAQLARMRAGGASEATLRGLAGQIVSAETGGEPPLSARILMLQSHHAAAQGDEALATDRVRRALAVAPNLPQARFSLGMLLAAADDARGALAQLLWLRAKAAQIPATSLRTLRATVANAFRTQGEVRLAQLTDALR